MRHNSRLRQTVVASLQVTNIPATQRLPTLLPSYLAALQTPADIQTALLLESFKQFVGSYPVSFPRWQLRGRRRRWAFRQLNFDPWTRNARMKVKVQHINLFTRLRRLELFLFSETKRSEVWYLPQQTCLNTRRFLNNGAVMFFLLVNVCFGKHLGLDTDPFNTITNDVT